MQNKNETLWTAAFLNERFTAIVSPLGWSFVGALFEQLALRDPLRYMGLPDADTIPATRLWHGHPYANVEIFQIFYKPFPSAFVPADAVRYFPNGDLTYRQRAPYPRSIFQPRFLLSLAYHLARAPLVASPWNYLAWRRFIPQHDARVALLKNELDAATNAQQVLRVIAWAYQLDAQFLRIHRWSLTYADLFYKLLTRWMGADAQQWISNVPNKTRQVNAELAALAQRSSPLSAELLQRIRAHEPLNQAERRTADALEIFLRRHGHRAFSLDIAQPTFRDDPTQLLGLLNASAQTDPMPPDFARLRAWQRPFVSFARRYAQLREDQRYYWHKSLAVTRSAYLTLGRDLAARKIIANADEIFYATRAEIAAYYGMELEPEELNVIISARMQEWKTYAEMDRTRGADAYPLFLHGDLPLQERAQSESQESEWRGRGVSAGVARGAVRVVHSPRELANVNAGEILVAPSTDPAWTPVFARLAGLVLERGGVLSHGAVVAREYHLPAVVGIADATRLLREGEQIEIDGASGWVRRVAESNS